MANSKTGRAVNQDDWKRTQLRMPQEQYKAIMDYAKKNNLSLNTAINTTIDSGLEQLDRIEQSDFQAPTISGIKKALPVRSQIRLPHELHAELVEEAKANEASLNDVMIYYLANRKQSKDNDGDKMLLVDESNLKTVEMVMEKIIANAISSLIKQGVDTTAIQTAFNIKD